MATQRDSNRADLSPRKVAERIKEEGKQRIERGKSTAADQVDQVASALKSAGEGLDRSPTLAAYANQLAGSIGRFGTRLRDGSLEDLAGDMQRAAQRNPTLFLVGGLALGIVLARVVKATATEQEPLLVGNDDFDDADLSTSGLSGGETQDNITAGTSTDDFVSGSASTARPFGS